jgi:hypothetical protein
MDSTQGTRWEAALATLVAIAVTSGMYWTLARLMRPWAAPVVVATSAIDVVWVARERTPARMAGAAGDRSTPPARSASRSPSRRAREAKRMNEPKTAATDAPAASRALSAVYLMQARTALPPQARAEPPAPSQIVRRPCPARAASASGCARRPASPPW